jgi:hypothetical protein
MPNDLHLFYAFQNKMSSEETKMLKYWFAECEGFYSTAGPVNKQVPFLITDEGIDILMHQSKENPDIYFRLCPMKGKPAKGRGTAEDSALLPGLWIDLDCGEKNNGKTYFPYKEDALAWLKDTFGRWLGCVVDSGTGLHAYFYFDEPGTEMLEAASVSRAFGKWVQALCPYDIDPTWDLARVLRLPGSLNKGKDVKVIYDDGRRINSGDLMEMIPPKFFSEHTPAAYSECKIKVTDALDAKTMGIIEAACSNSQAFSRAWAGKYPSLSDQSPSGYCMSIASRLVDLKVDDGVVMNILAHWRAKGGHSEKPPGWYQRTVDRAHDTSGRDNEQTARALDASDPDILSRLFGGKVDRIEERRPPAQYGSRGEPRYAIIFSGAEAEVVLTPTQLLNPSVVARKIMVELRKIPPMVKLLGKGKAREANWSKAVAIMLETARVVDDCADATLGALVDEALDEFVHSNFNESGAACSPSEFQRSDVLCWVDDRLGFRIRDFTAFYRELFDDRPNSREVTTVLVAAGCRAERYARARLWLLPVGWGGLARRGNDE